MALELLHRIHEYMNNVFLTTLVLFRLLTFTSEILALEIIDGRAILKRNEAEKIFYKNDEKSFYIPSEREDNYERINNVINDIHNLYVNEILKIFPEHSTPPVPLAIIEKDQKNAFVREVIIPTKGVFTPNVIIVGEKLINSPELYATIAHELSHYFLNHSRRRNGNEYTSYYTQNEDCFACEQTLGKDVNLDDIFNSLFSLRVHLSDLHPLDFRNVPLENSSQPNRLPKLLDYISNNANLELKSCNTYINEKKSIEKILLSRSSLLFSRIELSGTELKTIHIKLKNLKTNGKECFNNTDKALFDNAFKHVFFQNLNDIKTHVKENPEVFENLNDFLKGYYTIIFKNNNPFTKIVNLNEYISDFEKNLTILIEDFDRNQYKIITTEDEADMLMQTILQKNEKGKEVRDFFELEVLNSNDSESCLTSDLKSLPQENIYSIHHSNCFRYHRYLKLSEELKNSNTHDFLINFLITRNQDRDFGNLTH